MMFRWFDSNQGLNDQRLIYLEVPHTTYTSIFQHKTKSHILKRDIEVASQKNLNFYTIDTEKLFFKNFSFKEMGEAGLWPAASASACPPFLRKNNF